MNMEDRHPLPSAMRSWVLEELQRIEREHDVRVLYACESGSRAWGFASTDSDYDVRFVYVEKPEWFVQVDTPLQKRLRGTGLGLSLCKRFAELLGGHVGVDSVVGEGSDFYVVLPYKLAEETPRAEL